MIAPRGRGQDAIDNPPKDPPRQPSQWPLGQSYRPPANNCESCGAPCHGLRCARCNADLNSGK